MIIDIIGSRIVFCDYKSQYVNAKSCGKSLQSVCFTYEVWYLLQNTIYEYNNNQASYSKVWYK